jgi:hypothetical protein
MSPAMTNAAITLTAEVESIMSTLCDLLDRESEAVRTSDFDAFRDMQSDKLAMLTRYKSIVETLQRQSATLSSADAALLERLKKSSKKFLESSDRNTRTLEAGRQSMQRIIDRIVRGARETVHANRQSYNKQGHANGMQSPLCIQMDEVL